MAAKSRMPMWIGLAVAGAGGYYLYSAGGDPKRATRKFEDDASKAKQKIRGEVGDAERAGSKAGARIDEGIENARDSAKRLDQRASDYARDKVNEFDKARQDAARDMHQKVDSLERDVEKKAEDAKNGISSWFGSGKK